MGAVGDVALLLVVVVALLLLLALVLGLVARVALLVIRVVTLLLHQHYYIVIRETVYSDSNSIDVLIFLTTSSYSISSTCSILSTHLSAAAATGSRP